MDTKLFEILNKLNIKYKIYEHQSISTVEEADLYGLKMPGLNLKNLLLKDKKTNLYYLIILEDHKRLDLQKFKEITDCKKIRFADEQELYDLLKLKPGSVSPFGLINDINNKVQVVLSEEITNAKETELVNFHPNRNNATMALNKKDFIKFLEYLNKKIYYEN